MLKTNKSVNESLESASIDKNLLD